MLGFLKGLGKVAGGLLGLGGGGVDYEKLASMMGAAGAGTGAYSQGRAQNRGGQFAGQMDLEQLLMGRDQQQFNNSVSREQEGRAGSTDAWRKLLASQRLLSPGARPQNAGPYSVAPRQATGMERQGAEALSAEVMQRLMGGNPIAAPTQRPLSVDPSLLEAGKMESATGSLSPFLSFFGQQPRQKPKVQGYPDFGGSNGFGG
jgi:hypothetical protein